MIELSTKLKKAVVNDLLRAVKAIKKLKSESAKVFFPALQTDTWKIVVFTDAAHANLCDGVSSMATHVVLLCDKHRNCCLLSWQANKIKRVVRSTIAAEALSSQEGSEDAIYMRKLLEELLGLPEQTAQIEAKVAQLKNHYKGKKCPVLNGAHVNADSKLHDNVRSFKFSDSGHKAFRPDVTRYVSVNLKYEAK